MSNTQIGDLMRRHLDGDPGAFEELHAATVDALEACAFRFAPGRRADAEDAVARTYLEWASDPPRLSDPDGFLAYSRTMVRNHLRDLAARTARTRPTGTLHEVDTGTLPAALAASADAARRLAADLSELLGADAARMLYERDALGVPPRDLADRAGVKVESMSTMLSAWRRKARESLDRTRYTLLPGLHRWWQRNSPELTGSLMAALPAIALIVGPAFPTPHPSTARSVDSSAAAQLGGAALSLSRVSWDVAPPGGEAPWTGPVSNPEPDARANEYLPEADVGITKTVYRDEQTRWAQIGVTVAGERQQASADVPGPVRDTAGEQGVKVEVEPGCTLGMCSERTRRCVRQQGEMEWCTTKRFPRSPWGGRGVAEEARLPPSFRSDQTTCGE